MAPRGGVCRAGAQDRVFTVQPGQTAHVDFTARSVPWEALIVVTVVVVAAVVVVAVVAEVAGGGGGGNGNGFGDLLQALAPAGGPSRGGAVPHLPHVPDGGGIPKRVASDGRSGLPLARLTWDVDARPIDVNVWEPDDTDTAGPHIHRILPPAPDDPAGAVRIEFDHGMDPRSFDHDAIALTGANGDVAAGLWSPDGGRTAVRQPLRPLAPGSYTVVVDGGALSTRQGTPLEHGAAVLFEIAAR